LKRIKRLAHVVAGAVASVCFIIKPVFGAVLWLNFMLYELIEAWYFLQTRQRPDKVFRDILEFVFPQFVIFTIWLILQDFDFIFLSHANVLL